MSLKKMNVVSGKVSVELLREAVKYDEATGTFTWRERPVGHFPNGRPTPEKRAAMWNGKYAGKSAFTSKCPRGYLRGEMRGSSVYAHRAAIAYVTGSWPDGEVDHINRDKGDNRIENLRVVSHRENRLNTQNCDNANFARKLKEKEALARRRCHPIPGVRRQGRKTWSVRVKKGGVEVHCGTFACFGRAVQVRRGVQ